MSEPYADLPIMLKVHRRRCLVVGAGGVGVRRAKLLAEAGAHVVIIAPQVHPSARLIGAEIHERGFEPADLNGVLLAVAATSDPAVNQAVSDAATEHGVLVNRSDRAAAGDLAFMSSHRDGPLTVAVHTGGASASAAARIRSLLAESLDPAWAELLSLALPARQHIQAVVSDPAKRTAMLRRLTDNKAIDTLKADGESGLKSLYDDIMKDLA
ncbi:MAG: bifunctional precorrin-2 dehydrogenase/sirohydrochlorin ferrochelatase [Phycisphaeraceae bacterium]|nr:bifunctional precorrin-2 dehydrogenase/sirohydrochlorin ferrochelatase [Phycisphaeraceae bacterium]